MVSATVVAGLLIPGAAAAQGATQAAVDEYVAQQPSAGGTAGAEDQQVAGSQGAGGSQGAAGTAAVPGSGGGSLPFTGYPMTVLVWVMLALILTGLAIRFAIAGRQRLHRAPARS